MEKFKINELNSGDVIKFYVFEDSRHEVICTCADVENINAPSSHFNFLERRATVISVNRPFPCRPRYSGVDTGYYVPTHVFNVMTAEFGNIQFDEFERITVLIRTTANSKKTTV